MPRISLPTLLNCLVLQPLDGVDNQYGQLYIKITNNPYIQAGIKGIEPPMPSKVSV
jgi:hypothetical protein